MKCDHEVRKEKDKIQQELIKAGKVDIELDADTKSHQTAQDFEDASHDELSKFSFSSRETEDDQKKNPKSLNRELDNTLMLICEQKIGDQHTFLLPQSKWAEGESLRQTAERIVLEKLGADLKVHFYGNAPCGFHKYKYKSADRKDSVGTKIFFYRAAYKTGNVKDEKLKYEWVNENDLQTKLKESYFNSVSQLLVSWMFRSEK